MGQMKLRQYADSGQKNTLHCKGVTLDKVQVKYANGQRV